MPAQLTIRATEDLIERVRAASGEKEMSMNEWVTAVLDAATDPSTSSTVGQSVRERLA